MQNYADIKEKIDNLSETSDITLSQIDELFSDLRKIIKEDKSKATEINQYFKKLSRIKNQKFKKKQEKIIYDFPKGEIDKKSYWQQVGNGYLKIGHKPGGKIINIINLYNEGTTTVFTILGENEGAFEIEKQVRENNMDWIWLSLNKAKIPPKSRIPEIEELFRVIKSKLENKEKIYIHCSAGLHRTGMITFALLIFLGYDNLKAFEILKSLRPLTAYEVRNFRLKWAENFKNKD